MDITLAIVQNVGPIFDVPAGFESFTAGAGFAFVCKKDGNAGEDAAALGGFVLAGCWERLEPAGAAAPSFLGRRDKGLFWELSAIKTSAKKNVNG
jgi:hypothetical protein